MLMAREEMNPPGAEAPLYVEYHAPNLLYKLLYATCRLISMFLRLGGMLNMLRWLGNGIELYINPPCADCLGRVGLIFIFDHLTFELAYNIHKNLFL